MPDAQEKKGNSLRAQARRQQKQMRRTRGLLLVLLVGLVGIGGIWLWTVSPPGGSHAPVTIVIPRGASRMAIGRLLAQQGVIRSPYAFVLKTRLAGEEIKAGRYRLAPDMSLQQVMDALRFGPVAIAEGTAVTIPEGYTLRQIAELMQVKGITNGTELLRLAADKSAISQMQAGFELPGQTLEGYLFPDTYTFKPHAPPAGVLEEMLHNFGRRFLAAHETEIASSGHSLHEIVTIASLIEREAQAPQDRVRIAGVIENRLKRHMRLQIDATVLYALGHHKSRVLYRDLTVNSPYNTYRHAGLPPGPIANPGLPSLLAALHPENNDFLYYVAAPDGTHVFSRTPREHEAAKHHVRQERR